MINIVIPTLGLSLQSKAAPAFSQAFLLATLGEDPVRQEFAARCFHVGRGVEETRHLLSLDPLNPEVKLVYESSDLTGFDPFVDSITKSS